MQFLATVLIQDAAILFKEDPHSFLWKYPPFCTIEFHCFSEFAHQRITEIKEEHALAVKNLPNVMMETMKGIMDHNSHKQAQLHDQQSEEIRGLREDVSKLKDKLAMVLEPQRRPRRSTRKAGKKFLISLLA